MKPCRIVLAALLAIAILWGTSPAYASDTSDAGKDVSVIQNKLEWVASDIARLIEEIRRMRTLSDRTFLVEDIEDILYRDVEFPLVYQGQAVHIVASGEETGLILPSPAVTEAENPVLGQLYAKAYALAGLARSYEGFPAASEDYLTTARRFYRDVEGLEVRIDSFLPLRPISAWLEEARQSVKDQPVRVTLFGKAVAQDVVDNLLREKVNFRIERAGYAHVLQVASRDFTRGLRRRVVTDDPITFGRVGSFRIYLPAGQYAVTIGGEPHHASAITVSSNPALNRYFVETAGDGATLFAIPTLMTGTTGVKAEPSPPPPPATIPAVPAPAPATK